MSSNDVIEAYVAEVMRHLPRKERNEIGFELRDLLTQMLAERTQDAATDDAVLDMLRDFGAPTEVAARYRPPGVVAIIPAEQTKTFALLSLGGIALQWALTLPRVFDGQPVVAWWFSWGLGAFWWPGFMVTMALIGMFARESGMFKRTWNPRTVDPERINRNAMAFGLAWYAIGVAFMICLPWTAALLPEPMPRIFAFDPTFLRERAPPVILLWLGGFATMFVAMLKGRWSKLTRRLSTAFALGFVVLLLWWMTAGNIFLSPATDEGAKAGLGLVVVIIVASLAYELYRRRPRIHAPKVKASGT
ncbi:hypothetical protein [Pseudoxanthomonas sp. CF125]|jgi:hypothetical protein|uniref:hypothetical protein n=1 Tax=Pseudoxanthomonas sp. CF125 TaxID=1855303 RepID=UPI0008818A06|nr:hypothetical protein [Pseudoxanthomonas sp. CF125]SDQ33812.1 hypothetical protein SAMN05216569_0716 [Pseudoxanthomonas sp. CF125]